ncbi:MAG: acylneuraminate cytidylyltransferase family protein [Winogradskyella sp.]|uniref:acylneuraminate cytidylyltransferase family protein n=1 Tax=Winogradskyella sp. TaxID=1883156 RepID=UPI0017F40A34|nr:acylneuraminate cytidylyltransferase family protein [Winogradskyella sp.]
MRVLGIIPARGGSKTVPKKNIKELGGKPLLQYTVEAANDSKLISRLILSSDSDEIISVAEQLKLEVPFKRPIELAQDDSTTISVVLHALSFFEAQNIFFDAVCLLQVTSPFKTGEFIDAAIKKFINQGCDSLISVQRIPDKYNPHWTFKKDNFGNLKLSTNDEQIIPRRQDLPNAYHRDGLIYITKAEVILKQNSLYGKIIGFIESPLKESINIDTLNDWEKAESFLKSKNP